MIKKTKRRNRRNIGLIVSMFLENRCLARDMCGTLKRTCFVLPTFRHSSKNIRTPLFFSARNDGNDKDDNNRLSKSDVTGDTHDSADTYENKSNESGPEQGILLDSKTYLQADALLQQDGSLNIDFNPIQPEPSMKSPLYKSAADRLLSTPPNAFTDDDQRGNARGQTSIPSQQLTDEEMLLQAMTNIYNKSQRIDPELLHQQVFADEQTYLQQSEEFRKSLATLYDDGKETPMTKARREAIEIYNQGVLDSLLKEIDEMEEKALTREEAIKQARQKTSLSEHALCSKCGCKVTPDVIQRFEKMRMAQENGTREMQHRRLIMLCDACYGSQFRSSNEALTRLGAGQFAEASPAKMWDKKAYRPRRSGEQGIWGESPVHSSSFLQMPKRYGEREQVESNKQVDTVRTESGSRNLTRRKMELEPDSSHDLVKEETIREGQRKKMPQRQNMQKNIRDGVTIHEESSKVSSGKKVVKSETSTEGEEWVRVTDEKSSRMFYWNRTTGEMRKIPPK